MGTRSRSERDAITVEIGYALVTAGFVAATTFVGVVCPLFFLDVPSGVAHVLFVAAASAATVAFLARVVHVLWRFRGVAQPSQPGRTKPDS
ncbi:DUF6332 family protein [Streptomyces sp. NPDC090053]|uniref:DUF6332 family protein n=1 Tax=Streptomyces sp. NPDC090053 TaxID=3365932 RepID=UPI0037F7827C